MQIKLSEDATQLEFVQELILGNEPVSSIVIAPVAFSKRFQKTLHLLLCYNPLKPLSGLPCQKILHCHRLFPQIGLI